LTAVKGAFRNGRVELDEDPGIVGEAAVVVTFFRPDTAPTRATQPAALTFGMLAQPGRRMSDLDDLRVPEHADRTDDGFGEPAS
jgi:hypothetical protein